MTFEPMWTRKPWTALVTGTGRRASAGFTIMELMVVMVLVALLVAIAAPVVTMTIGRAKETALRQNLRVMRVAIDDYYADKGIYPGELEELVAERYIRAIPVDPLDDRRASWVVVYGEDEQDEGIVDIKSGSERLSSDGSAYNTW